MEALYVNAWMPNIQPFRPAVAFKGLSEESYSLETSLMRMGKDFAQIEPLRERFQK